MWHRFKKSVMTDVHQAKLSYKLETRKEKLDLSLQWFWRTPSAWTYLIPIEPIRITHALWVRVTKLDFDEWTWE